MSVGEGKSGRQAGAENVERLRAYLGEVESLPARNGKANLTAIAAGAGLDRQSLYKNPECSRLLDAALEQKGLVRATRKNDGKQVRNRREQCGKEGEAPSLFLAER